jgi:plasmid stability protein
MSERTTLTLEDDVAARLREEARRQGRPLKAVVNDALRAGLAQGAGSPDAASAFRVEPRDLGLRPGIDLDDIQGLLDRLDEAPPR